MLCLLLGTNENRYLLICFFIGPNQHTGEICGLDLKTKFLTGKLDDLKMGGYLETIKRPDILHKHKGHEGSQTYGQQGVFCVVIKINHA